MEQMKWDLRATMARHKKSINGLAKHLGANRNTIYRWLDGETYPTVNKLPEIAEYIGCPISEFLILDDTDFKSPRQGRAA